MHNEINFTGAKIIDSDIKNKIEVGTQSDSKEKEKLIVLMDQLEKRVNLLSENREYAQDLRKAVEQEGKAKAKGRLLELLSGTASITTILRGITALLR